MNRTPRKIEFLEQYKVTCDFFLSFTGCDAYIIILIYLDLLWDPESPSNIFWDISYIWLPNITIHILYTIAFPWLIVPAFSMFSIAGCIIMLTNLQTSNLFGDRRYTVMSSLIGGYQASAIVFLCIKVRLLLHLISYIVSIHDRYLNYFCFERVYIEMFRPFLPFMFWQQFIYCLPLVSFKFFIHAHLPFFFSLNI